MKDSSDAVRYMRMALEEAKKGLKQDEVPVGAVIVSRGQVIARGHNLTELLNDVTAHAEMQAITAAADYLGGKYLKGCVLYVTLEPCVMCAGALYWSQIDEVVYGASDPKRGASTKGNLYHPKTKVRSAVLADECQQLLTDFFQAKRK